MKRIIVSILLLPAYSAMAQMGMHSNMHSKMMKDSTISFGFYKTIGMSFQQFDELNGRVKGDPTYHQLCEAIGTLGLGAIIQKGHFVTLNNFTIGYGMNGNREKKNSTTGMLGFSADFGYNIFGRNSRVELFPTAGLGLEGYRVRLNKNTPDSDFDEVLDNEETQNDIRSVTFYNIYFNYRFGLNLNVKSPDKSRTIGLQGGYTASFNDRSWRVNYNQTLADAPSEKLSRFYVNLVMTQNIDWRKCHDKKLMN